MEVDERWLEFDFGRFESLTFAEIEALDPSVAARLAAGSLDVDWPAGERYADLTARVLAAFRDVQLRPDRTVLIVTHGGPIAVLLRFLQPTRAAIRFVGAGDALALEDDGTGTWTVRPVGIGSRP